MRRAATIGRLSLGALLLLTLLPPRASAEPRLLGVLQWRGYPQTYTWRMEWEPLVQLGSQGWEPLPGDGRPAVDTVWAPSGWGRFLPDAWSTTAWGCDTITVAVGRWEANTLPPDLRLEDPISGAVPGPWPLWGLADPATVWHTPGRPGELGEALSGLTRRARELTQARLTPGLEVDPTVTWVRENLRLADPLTEGSLELVGRFRGAVRLRGGGASSEAVVHFWVSHDGDRRVFRALLLDLPEAGAARLSRRLISVLRHPDTGEPILLFREESGSGRRHSLLELGADGVFTPVYETPWRGCD